MKKSIFVLSTFLIVFLSTHAQEGKVFDKLSMSSKILKSERNFAVYLPPGYDTSKRSYPVLYLLHGAGDDQTGWVQFGEVKHITDKAIKNGKATPMIIIMPDAKTGKLGYFNTIKGDWNYEDFFFNELMPYVEKKYRVKREKRYRAVAGLSMGGGGSFMYALHRPDLFSSACPLSAYVGPLSLEQLKLRIPKSEKYSKKQIEAYFKRHNAIELIKSESVEKLKSVRWFIDCGDDDFLYEGNSLAHIALTKKKIPHEYRVRDGAHNWTYWRASLPKVLRFVSQGFHQY